MKKIKKKIKVKIVEIKDGLNINIIILVYLGNSNIKQELNNQRKKNLWLGLAVIILIKMQRDVKK